jgi:uncharacterized membrane protein
MSFEPAEPPSDNDKLFAALSYVFWPVGLLVLLSETNKKRPFQRYHAVQALGFGVAAFVVLFVFICIDLVIGAVSNTLGALFSCLTIPIWLVPFAVAVWFAYRAYQGEMFDVPVVTDFVKGQGWL